MPAATNRANLIAMVEGVHQVSGLVGGVAGDLATRLFESAGCLRRRYLRQEEAII